MEEHPTAATSWCPTCLKPNGPKAIGFPRHAHVNWIRGLVFEQKSC